MARFIRRARAGRDFLLVSHDMPIVVDLCHRAVCMNAGRLIAAGDVAEVLQHPAVIEAYLGSRRGDAMPRLEVAAAESRASKARSSSCAR